MESPAARPVGPRPQPPGPGGDTLDDRDFTRIASLIREHIGIQLGPDKKLTVEGRLRKRARALGLGGLREYCKRLFAEGGLDTELSSLLDVMTTNKTDFFRESDHFDLLRSLMVPETLARRRGARPVLKLWSAAASTGAEAYSMAMVLADMAADGAHLDFAILGTDISSDVLETARLAIYPAEFLDPVPQPLRRFVLTAQSPRMRGKVRIAPEIRGRVRFQRLNLMGQRYAVDSDVDIVFLRNVLIYFDRNDQAAVIRRILGHMRPGGFLVLGHAETMVGNFAARTVAPAVFQKEG